MEQIRINKTRSCHGTKRRYNIRDAENLASCAPCENEKAKSLQSRRFVGENGIYKKLSPNKEVVLPIAVEVATPDNTEDFFGQDLTLQKDLPDKRIVVAREGLCFRRIRFLEVELAPRHAVTIGFQEARDEIAEAS